MSDLAGEKSVTVSSVTAFVVAFGGPVALDLGVSVDRGVSGTDPPLARISTA